MATWIAHIRLAQNLLDYGFQLAVEPFVLGNIAPDASIQNKSGNWLPPRNRTHWLDDNHNIQPEDFYEACLANKTSVSAEEYAFLMGYYCHLVADNEWIAQIWQPMSRFPEWQAVINNPHENIRTIKQDWYGQDFIYLRDNPDSLYATVFKQAAACPDYINYLPQGGIMERVNHIRAYYEDGQNKQSFNTRDYAYFDKHSMDSYVECTTIVLVALLEAKGVSCPNPRPLSVYGIRLVA